MIGKYKAVDQEDTIANRLRSRGILLTPVNISKLLESKVPLWRRDPNWRMDTYEMVPNLVSCTPVAPKEALEFTANCTCLVWEFDAKGSELDEILHNTKEDLSLIEVNSGQVLESATSDRSFEGELPVVVEYVSIVESEFGAISTETVVEANYRSGGFGVARLFQRTRTIIDSQQVPPENVKIGPGAYSVDLAPGFYD